MNKYLHTMTILFLLLLGFNSKAKATDVLTFGQVSELPSQSICASILREVYNRLNIRIKIIELPGRRSVIESRREKIDGEVCRVLSFGRELPNLVKLSIPVNYASVSAFILSKNKKVKISGWDSIGKYKVGIIKGIINLEEATKKMAQVTFVNSIEQLCKMLELKRIDLFIATEFDAKIAIKKLKLEKKIKALSTPLRDKSPLYHYINSKHSVVISGVEKELLRMQKSGELAMLIEKFSNEILNQRLE